MAQASPDPKWSESRVPGTAGVVCLTSAEQAAWAITCDEEGRLARAQGQLKRLLERSAWLKRLRFHLVGSHGNPARKPGANAVPVVGYSLQRSEGALSSCYCRGLSGWELQFQVLRRLNAIAVLRDGSVLAGGDLVSVHQEENTWRIVAGPARLVRVWGAHQRCAYALGERIVGRGPLGQTGFEATWVERDLFYFDGDRWTPIELEKRGIRGFFTDGSCDVSGFGWIVGTHQTHSCMARGRQADWESDGCGSWYLDYVDIQDDSRGYALGGDGLWRLHEGGWEEVEAYHRGRWEIRFPQALRLVDGVPLIVTDKKNSERRPAVHELDAAVLGPESAGGSPVREFDVFVSGRWLTIEAPARFEEGAHRIAIGARSTLLLAQRQSVWESCPLTELVQPE